MRRRWCSNSQQMQAALHAEIESAQPVCAGVSVALAPDYLPGLEGLLDRFREQYPHLNLRFRLLENDAVAAGVEQGSWMRGQMLDLGCCGQGWYGLLCGQTRPACWCRGTTPVGKERAAVRSAWAAGAAAQPAAGPLSPLVVWLRPGGLPRRQSWCPASTRHIIWCRTSSAPDPV